MQKLSDSVQRKFTDVIDVDFLEVETDTGYQPVSSINTTELYEIYEVAFESGNQIQCADNHIFITSDGFEIFAKDQNGYDLLTKNGKDRVVKVSPTGKYEEMYDLSVDSEDHTYYTNGVLSHNSTIMAAILCHYIIFNDNKTCAILANKASTAREILSRVQMAYEHLPKWLQHGVLEWNKGQFLIENGSRVIAASTSASAIRGMSINFLALDEFGFLPQNIAEEFFASVYPTISSGQTSKLMIISTPNGMNMFYKMWMDAEAGLNGFKTVKAIWSDIPTRDAKWAAEQRAVLGEVKFQQECECAFIGASNTLISGQKLKSIPIEKPMSASQTLRIYAEPVPGNQYVMNVDTARGTGNDYSAYTIINVTSLPYTVDAVYADNEVSPLIFPGLIMNMCKRYNNAAVLVETNDIGESVASTIYYDYEYEETVMTTDKGEISVFGGDKPGLRTTKKTKQVGCSLLKTLIENDQLIIRDADILYEISNFVLKGASYEAENGHDDLVMTLVLFAYLTSQPLMQELTNSSAKARILELRQQQAEDQMLPVGFMSDGTEKEIEVFNF